MPGLNSNLAPSALQQFSAPAVTAAEIWAFAMMRRVSLYPGAMQMGWMEFFNRKANLGLYYANHDPESRLTALYFELRPFTKSAEVGDNWPTPADVPAGEPIGLTMGWMKFPYLKRGTFNSGPVALQVHRGDWHEGSELYRAWFDQHFQVKRPPTWLRKEMAWQSVIISNCEDVIVWKFQRPAQAGGGCEEIRCDDLRDSGLGHGRHRSRLSTVPSQSAFGDARRIPAGSGRDEEDWECTR